MTRTAAELLIEGVIRAIGEDPESNGLKDTPGRVVRSWDTLYGGYKQNPQQILNRQFQAKGHDQMILLKDIEMFSTCEHHMLPFYGKAHVAYLPGQSGSVVGLSKLARLVDCYARRMQIQERLTDQIAEAIKDHLQPLGVGVMIEAKHMCMLSRGVCKQNSVMVTSSLHGKFREPEVRDEFFSLIKT